MLGRGSAHILTKCTGSSSASSTIVAAATSSTSTSCLAAAHHQASSSLLTPPAINLSRFNSQLTGSISQRRYTTAASAVPKDEDESSSDADGQAATAIPIDVPCAEGDLNNFAISESRKEILKKLGIHALFEIQSKTFSIVAAGKDLVARAQTGSGKTLGFALPIVEKLAETSRTKNPRCLVMAPTRELAKQDAKAFSEVGPELRVTCVYGGAPYFAQASELRRGTDVLVATPGRLIDLMGRGDISLADITHVVLDEADEMLRVGFKEQVDEILTSAPSTRQTLLFSATIPPWVQNICRTQLRDPVKVDLLASGKSKVVSGVKHLAIEVTGGGQEAKDQLLADLVSFYSQSRCIVFTATKRQADLLVSKGVFRTDTQVLHGDIAQTSRELTLEAFRKGVFRVLVATDVAARGIDIPEVDLVIQYDVPNDVEGYIHRSGRTGRAGRAGTAIIMFDNRERRDVSELAKGIGRDFVFIQPPSPQTVAEQKAQESAEQIRRVSKETLAVFHNVAKQLTEQTDPHDVISAALAVLSGYKDGILKRSLLASEPNMETVYMSGNYYTKSRAMQKLFFSLPELSGKIGSMRKTSDGVVFDVPASLLQSVTALDGVEHITHLPPLEEFADSNSRTSTSFPSRDGSRFGSNDRRPAPSMNFFGKSDNTGRGGFSRDDRSPPRKW